MVLKHLKNNAESKARNERWHKQSSLFSSTTLSDCGCTKGAWDKKQSQAPFGML